MKLQECTCMCGCKRLDLENICDICRTGLCKIISYVENKTKSTAYNIKFIEFSAKIL